MTILKCIDCGNTFKIENIKDGELVSCPVCDAEYKVSTKDDKITLKDDIYENEDQ